MTPAPTATDTPPAVVQTRIYQQGLDGYAGATDTFIDAWLPAENYASEGKLIVRQRRVRSPLVRFDLGDFPPGHRVIQATFSLYIDSASSDRTLTAAALPLNRPWKSNQATWLLASDTDQWGIAGAN